MRSANFLFAAVLLLACGDATEPTDLPVQPPATNAPPSSPPAEPNEPNEPPANTCEGPALVVDVARWQRAGTNPQGYEMTPDESRSYCDKPGAHLRSLAGATSDEFGTYMDVISAAAYRGKRVRLRGVVETSNVTGSAGFWLRVDDANKKMLALDNMGKRRLEGTRAPSEQSVVLDVANEANELAFGVLLSGGGEVWIEKVVIEVVGNDVPTTGP
jgi:hypothetical protein